MHRLSTVYKQNKKKVIKRSKQTWFDFDVREKQWMDIFIIMDYWLIVDFYQKQQFKVQHLQQDINWSTGVV